MGPASFPALLSQAAPASFLGSSWGTAPSPQPPADPAGEGILELAGLEDGAREGFSGQVEAGARWQFPWLRP